MMTNDHLQSSAQVLQPSIQSHAINMNSTGRLPSNNSLAMLKVLENFRLSQQKKMNNLEDKNSKSPPSKNKKRQTLGDKESQFTRHDGLQVDYSKFTNLTKEVLKNANIVRAKNIRSPAKAPSIHQPRNSNPFSPESMGTLSQHGGGGLSIPPMSARMSTQNTATRNQKITKKHPESPSLNLGR